MAFNCVAICLVSVQRVVHVIHRVQHRFRRCGDVRASRLASSFRIASRWLHSAELLGVGRLIFHKFNYDIHHYLYSCVWHQVLRKLVTGHANFIAKQLRLPKNSFTTCFKLFIAFFVSGLIHHFAEYILYQKWGGRSMEFFLLQAVAITFEDIIISLAARAGLSSKPNLFYNFIGFVWIYAWFTYSLPMWLDNMIQAGLMDDGVNYSLILGLWRGDWTPSR